MPLGERCSVPARSFIRRRPSGRFREAHQHLVVAEREAVLGLELVVEGGEEAGRRAEIRARQACISVSVSQSAGQLGRFRVIGHDAVYARLQGLLAFASISYIVAITNIAGSTTNPPKEPPWPPPRPRPAVAPGAGTYALDPTHSYVSFTARHLMVTKVRGRFPRRPGASSYIAEDPSQSSVDATIDVSAVESGDPKRDEHLRSADFFDTEQLPDHHVPLDQGRRPRRRRVHARTATSPSAASPVRSSLEGRVPRHAGSPWGDTRRRLQRRDRGQPQGLGPRVERRARDRRRRRRRQDQARHRRRSGSSSKRSKRSGVAAHRRGSASGSRRGSDDAARAHDARREARAARLRVVDAARRRRRASPTRSAERWLAQRHRRDHAHRRDDRPAARASAPRSRTRSSATSSKRPGSASRRSSTRRAPPGCARATRRSSRRRSASRATWDPDLIERIGAVIREQMVATGARHTLAPVLDIARDPRWGRVEETYGESPYLTARLGRRVRARRPGRPRATASPQPASTSSATRCPKAA